MNTKTIISAITSFRKEKNPCGNLWYIGGMILLVLFSSCNKPGDLVTIVEGTFKTARIDEIVPGGPYKIYLYSRGFGNDNPLDSTYTDANGQFYFKHVQPDGPRYQLQYPRFYLHAKGDFPKEYGTFHIGNYWNHMGKYIIPGDQGPVDLWLFKRAWIKIHLVNNTNSPDEAIWFQFQSSGTERVYGSADTSFYFSGAAHVTSIISYALLKNGVMSSTIFEEVVLPPFDTLYYRLEY
ncbi:MAG: hypothetical protein JJU02_06890 [Cryomorphaceae bacterium]|nr:hypothetical protein [Cryomorphaceae bacterium]